MKNKLISMVYFVLEQDKLILTLSPSRSGVTQWNEFTALKLDRITNYANFLKQPLTLDMFMPCDEEGSALEIPTARYMNNEERWGTSVETLELKLYQQAKEKVLFEGIKNSWDKTNSVKYPKAIVVESKKGVICSKFKDVRFYKNYKTIEDLIELDLTLTKSALKQIGINQ